ncbi:SGNH/GDSL hydrolase family protein [Paenibacillus albidus]|uniref:SGNH/GDSL hydrolase family protein n=1 Tax=Paenibacillus albidus TaxID=2041023 RepID=UPI001BE68A7F|nr:GDSL-type esterase/lipase family protein [Paenibacillus albidus]MBT2290347.1 SGNH/GDSL hydrolase family protein [Paenibacillus albidus]
MSNPMDQDNGILNQKDYSSATVLSSAANYIMNKEKPFIHTFRTYIRLRETGALNLRLWHSNNVDSTWDQGVEAKGSEPGGAWVIEAAYVSDGGQEPRGQVIPGTQVAVTFDGESSKAVAPGETFWSDELELDLAEGHYLAFTWTIRTLHPGKSFPFNVEGMLVTAYDALGNLADRESAEGFAGSDNLLVLPSYIGYRKKGARRLVFLGDSITQGVRTAKDEYEYWAARIAAGLGKEYGLWNIGSGWGRAYDVAAGGSWLTKAKQGDEVLIVLGVNDLDIGNRTAEELLGDLTSIIVALKEANPEVSILLGTVPPFNFQAEKEEAWRYVNRVILNGPPAGTDRVFDIASVLSMPAPHEHLIRPEYMSGAEDPHPNGIAGQAVADAFLNWYDSGI